MKHYKLFVPLLFFAALPWILGSCCYSGGSELTSATGLSCEFNNYNLRLVKVEFIGTNKSIAFGRYDYGKVIPFNPKDTVCNLRIYYEDEGVYPTVVKDGTVTISYKGTPEYKNDGCENTELVISYEAKVSSTTFVSAKIINNSYNGYAYGYGPTLEISN